MPFLLKLPAVVIADDIFHARLVRLPPCHLGQVDKALALFGMFGAVESGQKIVEIDPNLKGVYEFVLGGAG